MEPTETYRVIKSIIKRIKKNSYNGKENIEILKKEKRRKEDIDNRKREKRIGKNTDFWLGFA